MSDSTNHYLKRIAEALERIASAYGPGPTCGTCGCIHATIGEATDCALRALREGRQRPKP